MHRGREQVAAASRGRLLWRFAVLAGRGLDGGEDTHGGLEIRARQVGKDEATEGLDEETKRKVLSTNAKNFFGMA